MRVLTVQEMRQAEAAADAGGLSFARLMENAGSAVAQEMTARLTLQNRSVLVLVGPGNNGGDGLVAARYLHDARAKVTVFLALPRPDDDPNLVQVRQRSIDVIAAENDTDLQQLAARANSCDVVIDALLGTGIARPIDGILQNILQAVAKAATQRQSPPLIVAVDLPSGLNADTGEVDPVTLPASLTVTFSFPKRGHFLFPGANYVGALVTADIGINPALVRDVPVELAELGFVASLLPRRPRDANKGSFGKVLAIAGCANYTGAAHLASMAAYRAGAGLVTLAHAASLHAALAAKSSEVTFQPLPEAEPGYIGAGAAGLLLERRLHPWAQSQRAG